MRVKFNEEQNQMRKKISKLNCEAVVYVWCVDAIAKTTKQKDQIKKTKDIV